MSWLETIALYATISTAPQHTYIPSVEVNIPYNNPAPRPQVPQSFYLLPAERVPDRRLTKRDIVKSFRKLRNAY